MDEKTLHTLEYPKILDRLAEYCAFGASVDKALALLPTNDLYEARRRLAETGEAIQLLETHPGLTIGGARDIRQAVDLALHGSVLDPGDLLDVKYTMVAARTLIRTLERLENEYPNMADLAAQIPPPMGIIDSVSRAISDRGEILDTASDKLRNIRRELRVVHDRLLTRLQRMVADQKYAPFLQEALVTQRDGRYVLPLRAEFKGRIKSIIHDQSSSGATLFIEPLGVVELNNQHRELQLDERDEERRILTELSALIGQHAYEIQLTVDVISEIDLVLARANYASDLRCSQPTLRPITPAKNDKAKHPGSIIRLYQARHPLLDPESVVPIDVELDDRTYALVVTGPNTGGKTVTLKTVGLLALMAQSGLHLPVDAGSEISVFQKIFADIGDEQSIEQSLSTFSSHITNIIRILEQANSRSLVVLDELGAGTDPQEGAALARSLLDHLLEREITTLVTTHHPELKAYAHSTSGVVNASVEFDLDTLRPTYHLVIGLPGRSNALDIAQRLGLPKAIVDGARKDVRPEDLTADSLLDEIHHQRDLAQAARDSAERFHKEAEALRAELMERLENIEDERREVIGQARLEAEEQIKALQDEAARVRQALKRARQPADALEAVDDVIADLEEKVERPIERQKPVYGEALERMEAQRRRTIRLGDKVHLRTLNTTGVVSAISQDEAEVQVGVLRIRARLAELEAVSEQPPETSRTVKTGTGKSPKASVTVTNEKQGSSSVGALLFASPGIELDLRGQRADEALDSLDSFLDAAFLARLPYVRIIHGKGTGKLRTVIRQELKGHMHVKSFQPGGEKEGGDGVTVAMLKDG